MNKTLNAIRSVNPQYWSGIFAVGMVLVLMSADAAMAQDINLDPIQNFLQGLVDLLTGTLGIVIATLALIGVFITWLFGYVDFRVAMWVVIAIAGIGGASTMVGALWAS